MLKSRVKFIFWTMFLSVLFISMGSIQQTVQALGQDDEHVQASDIAYVFDLNGVLFDTSKSTVFRQMGMKDTLWYVATNGSSTLKSTFYHTLNLVAGTEGNSLGVSDPDGAIMPELMINWLQGSASNSKIGSRIIKAIANHPEWFSSSTEQRLMNRMTYAIFKPEKFAASRTLLTGLIPFIKSLKRQGVQLYVLSNWDAESFQLVKEKYNDLFELFDGCIISGECGYVKPQPEIFSYLKKKIPASVICFLDDQQENIEAARAAGLYTILVTQKKGYLRSSIDVSSIVKQGIAILRAHNRASIAFAS